MPDSANTPSATAPDSGSDTLLQQAYQRILDSMGPSVIAAMLDTDARILAVSGPTLEIANLEADELIGQPLLGARWWTDLDATARASIEEAIERTLRGASASVDAPAQVRDGAHVRLALALTPIQDDAERTIAILVRGQPTLDAESVQRENERLQLALNLHTRHSPIATIEWTPQFRVRHWSTRATAMFGWQPAEVHNKRPHDWAFFEGDDHKKLAESVASLISHQHENATVRLRCRRRDGQVLHCDWYNSALHAEDGAIKAVLSLVNDVTAEVEAARSRAATESLFEGIFSQAALGIALLHVDGRCMRVNDAFRTITGYTNQQLVNHTLDRLVPRDADEPRWLTMPVKDPIRVERCIQRGDGEQIWVKLTLSRYEDPHADEHHLIALLEDIRAQKAAEDRYRVLHAELEDRIHARTEELASANEQWRQRNDDLALLNELVGLVPVCRSIDEAVQVSMKYLPRLCAGWDGVLYLADDADTDLIPVGDWGDRGRANEKAATDSCWAMRRNQPHWTHQADEGLVCQHAQAELDGSRRQSVCIPLVARQQTIGLLHLVGTADAEPPDLVLLRSLGEQLALTLATVQLGATLREQAIRDPLTGLLNRRQLTLSYAQLQSGMQRHDRHASLILIDLDWFKRINDTHGHDIGDKTLVAVTSAIHRGLRSCDIPVRHGGEEFAVLLPESDIQAATSVAQRIRAAIGNLRIATHTGDTLHVTASMGIAAIRPEMSLETATRLADEALYRAKQNGRNRVELAAGATLTKEPPEGGS